MNTHTKQTLLPTGNLVYAHINTRLVVTVGSVFGQGARSHSNSFVWEREILFNTPRYMYRMLSPGPPIA